MKDNGFRNGFMTAVFMFIGIAVVVLVGKNLLPSVGEAFVLESVSEISESDSSSAVSSGQGSVLVSALTSSVIISSSTSSAVSAPTESTSGIKADPPESTVQSSEPLIVPPPESSVQSSEPPVVSVPESSPQVSEPVVDLPPESVSGLININIASANELQRLNGIGEVKARAIIDYREQNGGFSSVDELINVKGIGEKTLEKIRADITV